MPIKKVGIERAKPPFLYEHSTQPKKVNIRPIIFALVIFSLNKIAENTVTKIGAVYIKIHATDKDALSIVAK